MGSAPTARGRAKHAPKSTSRHAEHLAEEASGPGGHTVGDIAVGTHEAFQATAKGFRGARDVFHRLASRLAELYPLEWRFDSAAMSCAFSAVLHAAAGGRGRRGGDDGALEVIGGGGPQYAHVAVRERGRLVPLAGLSARDVAGLVAPGGAAGLSLDGRIGAVRACVPAAARRHDALWRERD